MDVLFVCLGNICRSPMAEAVFRHHAKVGHDHGSWLIDSAGTGDWHVGSQPHPGTISVCRGRGVAISHPARQIERSDFHRFDLILAMDRDNMAALRTLRPRHATAQARLLGSFDPAGEDEVLDPYQSGDEASFLAVYEQVERCCKALLATIPLPPR